MIRKKPYLDRDESWLSFNYRVLQEAKDPSVPLLDRIKFMAIYSSNLDEFFRIRIAGHRSLLRLGRRTMKKLDYEPGQILSDLLMTVKQQQEEFSYIFENQIVPLLAKHKIRLLRRYEVNEEQKTFMEQFFYNNLLPFVQPVLLVEKRIRPFLNNAALYLVLHMQKPEDTEDKPEYAIVKIPSDHISRFISLPQGKTDYHDIIILDDIVRESVKWLFPGYTIINSYSIKLTRDAELYIDDEYSGDLIQKIKRSLSKRNVGPASRLVYDREIPPKMLNYLMSVLELTKEDVIPEGRYHNNSDFFKFPDFGLTHLKDAVLPVLTHTLDKVENIFTEIDRQDHLLCLPYHSFNPVVRFFESAISDPSVTHIKIILYRVAKSSRIMQALIKAVEAGKHVSAFVEVKARFDEEANLAWAEKLEKAGVQVHYSFPGLKVHSKVALIRKVEINGPKIYGYFGTGNFHEDTARIYGDFGLFTTDKNLISEATRLFDYLETVKLPTQKFNHLLVGQFNLRSHLLHLIHEEIRYAKEGKPAEIILKLNALQDEEMISHLYDASQAGVKVKLIIRGICSLIPGIKGFSENIEAISIIDRYLEHARVYLFHHGGQQLMYLSSADWMVRNLSYRIEVAFPIYDHNIKQQIVDLLELQWKDNIKARIIDIKQNNQYRNHGDDIGIRSQIESYYYLKRMNENI